MRVVRTGRAPVDPEGGQLLCSQIPTRLCGLADRVLLTVPNEPYFRLCNSLMRRDVLRLGNHPEHAQPCSARAFLRYASGYASIERATTFCPFTLVIGSPRPIRPSSTWLT